MAARSHERNGSRGGFWGGFWGSWFREELSSVSWILLMLALMFGAAYAGLAGEALSALSHY